MSYVFVATPYRSFPGSLDDAWEASVQALIPFRRSKLPAISPIALYHAVAVQGGFDPHEMAWAEMNKPILLNSAAMVVVKIAGHEKSEGIFIERNLALENRIPIFECYPGEVPLELVKQFTSTAAAGSLGIGDLRKADPVDRPSHYQRNDSDIEAIDVIEAFVDDPISSHHGNVLKYAMRFRRKGGAEDLKKMKRYTDRIINLLNGERKW